MKRPLHYPLILVCLAMVVISFGYTIHQTQPEFKFTDNDFVVGATLTRRNITFADSCQTKIKGGMRTLDSLGKMLIQHPNLKIEVGVYASKPCKICTACSQTQNGAETIRTYLIKKGIGEARVLAKGYGLTQPLVKNSEKKAALINARIVIKIAYNKF